MKTMMLAALLTVAGCAAEKPVPLYQLRSMPPGTTRQQAKHDLYECAKDAVAMAPTQTYRAYSTWGPYVTEKMAFDKRLVAYCMSGKGYEFTPLAPGEPPHDPWR